MQWLDLTLPSCAANLALDEALLDVAERAGKPHEILRLWEPQTRMVVIGRSSHVDTEVHIEACKKHHIPVLRRVSGGAAILAGPGCLMYSLVLSYERHPILQMIDCAHEFVLGRMSAALARMVPGVKRAGTSDLTLANERKFSGNSIRCRRTHLLYHGTILYDFSVEMLGEFLGSPPREPNYRKGRDHESFVTNLPVSASRLREAIREAWQAADESEDWPMEATDLLVAEKYTRDSWNLSH